jgi:hypothetical protein
MTIDHSHFRPIKYSSPAHLAHLNRRSQGGKDATRGLLGNQAIRRLRCLCCRSVLLSPPVRHSSPAFPSPPPSTTWYALRLISPSCCGAVRANLNVVRRYALPLFFPSSCAKPCVQTLTYYSYSDLNLMTSVYACITPTAN